MINKINDHSIPNIPWKYACCSSYFRITLLQNIQIKVPRSIVLVTSQTHKLQADTKNDRQAETSFALEKNPRIFYS